VKNSFNVQIRSLHTARDEATSASAQLSRSLQLRRALRVACTL